MRSRILGLDYGKKRIGVAVSDPLGIIAVGLPTVTFKSLSEAIVQIKQIIAGNHAQQIVVGFPYNLRGEINQAGRITETFISVLEEETNLPVTKLDERFTSVIANDIIKALGKSPSKSREKKDELSARLILQQYLDQLNSRTIKE